MTAPGVGHSGRVRTVILFEKIRQPELERLRKVILVERRINLPAAPAFKEYACPMPANKGSFEVCKFPLKQRQET
jgi:hypothetical protein